MSGVSPSPAEHHLGDRLAALVDGELNHDARERVLAHLATCPRCKAEADAQRRVKSLFTETAVPLPSEGLLARLQGLPGGGLPGGGDGGYLMPADGGFPTAAPAPRPPADTGRRAPFAVEYAAPAARGRRRFAFAAAGAVSVAAIALGGAMPMDPVAEPAQRGDGVTPARSGMLSVADERLRERVDRPVRAPLLTPAASYPAQLPPVVTPAPKPVSLTR
ncbi:anti-sigma factor family protein [Streptomyces sp. NPDC086023]|uniref:anti-sigma factor family protein n=1 Tax=Streptomyces sp. NPDC086023 TaxID=3365746 RepID=UPI0037CCD66F